jgi:hypothetical protein
MSLTIKKIRQFGLIALGLLCLLLGSLIIIDDSTPSPVQAAGVYGDITTLQPAHIPQQQNTACDGSQTGLCNDGRCTHVEDRELACIFNRGVAEWYGQEGPPPPTPPAGASPIEAAPVTSLVENGNFEFGFYQVPELGFEPPDVGNVPLGWGWYKNQAYGKYKIDNNQRLGLICPYDPKPTFVPSPEDSFFGPVPGLGQTTSEPNNALELHMQSTDQIDARIGVYQTVDVVPGQVYQFSMSTTLQIQSGATTLQPDDPEAPLEAQNHTIELYFDHTGNTNWRTIPHPWWTIIPFEENKLEFQVSEDDEDLANIQNYMTYIEAQSNQMTIFITFWRKWANWRTGIASVDCVALIPVDRASVEVPIGPQPAAAILAYDNPARAGEGAEPAVLIQGEDIQPLSLDPPASPQIVPASGGVLERTRSVLTMVASVIVSAGLIGAGIWNMRR